MCFRARSGRHVGGKASSTKTHHSRVCFHVKNGGPGGGNPLNIKTRLSRRGPVLQVRIEVVARSRAQKHTHLGVVSCSKWTSRRQKGFGFENTLIGV